MESIFSWCQAVIPLSFGADCVLMSGLLMLLGDIVPINLEGLRWNHLSPLWSGACDVTLQSSPGSDLDWPVPPLAGQAGPLDHLVKGEREEAVRVWYGNAEP